jgi:hypothetical protein
MASKNLAIVFAPNLLRPLVNTLIQSSISLASSGCACSRDLRSCVALGLLCCPLLVQLVE